MKGAAPARRLGAAAGRLRAAAVGSPLPADALLALLLLGAHLSVLAFAEHGDTRPLGWGAVPLILAGTLPLAWRRRHPVAVWLVVGVAAIIYGILPLPDPPIPFAATVAVYSLAAWTSRRTALLLGGVTAVAVAAALLVPESDAHARDFAFSYLVLGSAWVLGDSARTRRAYTAALEDRAARLERERELQARRAVAEERSRIARELHDVVAHHVSMMVVQAEAGPLVVEPDPARATGAFDTIAGTGRQALVELRRLLGVLRGDGEPPPALLPQPGLDQLDLLLDQVRRAGVPVELVVEGTPVPLPPGVELSAYRIVQEALTNTVKHAGPTRARVLVRYGADELELRVVDGPQGPLDRARAIPRDGQRAGRAAGEVAADGGHGLLGMRERVSLFGGRLEAGRRPEGGFAVSARLPLGERR